MSPATTITEVGDRLSPNAKHTDSLPIENGDGNSDQCTDEDSRKSLTCLTKWNAIENPDHQPVEIVDHINDGCLDVKVSQIVTTHCGNESTESANDCMNQSRGNGIENPDHKPVESVDHINDGCLDVKVPQIITIPCADESTESANDCMNQSRGSDIENPDHQPVAFVDHVSDGYLDVKVSQIITIPCCDESTESANDCMNQSRGNDIENPDHQPVEFVDHVSDGCLDVKVLQIITTPCGDEITESANDCMDQSRGNDIENPDHQPVAFVDDISDGCLNMKVPQLITTPCGDESIESVNDCMNQSMGNDVENPDHQPVEIVDHINDGCLDVKVSQIGTTHCGNESTESANDCMNQSRGNGIENPDHKPVEFVDHTNDGCLDVKVPQIITIPCADESTESANDCMNQSRGSDIENPDHQPVAFGDDISDGCLNMKVPQLITTPCGEESIESANNCMNQSRGNDIDNPDNQPVAFVDNISDGCLNMKVPQLMTSPCGGETIESANDCMNQSVENDIENPDYQPVAFVDHVSDRCLDVKVSQIISTPCGNESTGSANDCINQSRGNDMENPDHQPVEIVDHINDRCLDVKVSQIITVPCGNESTESANACMDQSRGNDIDNQVASVDHISGGCLDVTAVDPTPSGIC